MANYVVSDTALTSIADAIREKGETTSPLSFPDGFVEAIGDISGGGVYETDILSQEDLSLVLGTGTSTVTKSYAQPPVLPVFAGLRNNSTSQYRIGKEGSDYFLDNHCASTSEANRTIAFYRAIPKFANTLFVDTKVTSGYNSGGSYYWCQFGVATSPLVRAYDAGFRSGVDIYGV